LPDDLDPVADPSPWVALLPALDPTTMGWKGRDFYLGPHREQIFDSRGNGCATIWADGRIVGYWTQDDNAAVVLHLLKDLPDKARKALDAEADRLTQWLDGVRIRTGYQSPAFRR
jgi:hypothetical protein